MSGSNTTGELEFDHTVIVWKAPPNSARKYSRESDQMRNRPGEWAQFPDTQTPRSAYNLADNIRRGRLVAFAPAGSFEAIARNCSVWARYTGGEQQ